METRFYSGISTAEVIPPSGNTLDNVHLAYVEMAASGCVTGSQRAVFDSACKQLFEEAEVDAIMLGGTDLVLVYDDRQTDFPLVDCAAIHVKAVVQTATS